MKIPTTLTSSEAASDWEPSSNPQTLSSMRDIPIHSHLTIPSSELRERFVRSSGPGGQNVNKVATKVELRWNLTSSQALSDYQRQRLLEKLSGRLSPEGELRVTCDEFRSQERNREQVRRKLAELLRSALRREKKRKATKPSRGSIARRIAGKKQRSQVKKMRSRPKID